MSETIILAIIGGLLVLSLIVFINMPAIRMYTLMEKINRGFDSIDDIELDLGSSGADWLEESRMRTMRLLFKRPEAMPAAKNVYKQVENLLGFWNTVLADNEFMYDFEDTERMFKISITNIERICKEYVNDQCSYDDFTKELKNKANTLSDFISNLSELADIRQRFGHAQ